MVNVLFIGESHRLSAGGVTTVVDQLATAVTGVGGRARVIAWGSDASDRVQSGNGYVTRLQTPWYGQPWRWSPKLHGAIKEGLAELPTRLIHIHGVWMAPQFYGARLAARLGAASILSVHGMMEPWHWDEKGLIQLARKRIYWSTIGQRTFKRISVVHAITGMERDNLRSLFPGARFEVIPNAIDLEWMDARRTGAAQSAEPYLLFLGRLHRKKGIELLIRAFDCSGAYEKLRLLIAGTGDTLAYEVDLKEMARQSRAAARIEFLGPVYGDRKWELIQNAWALVVPSYSEVVGMVNLEAAALNVPTVTTYETGIERWSDGGGLQIHPTEDQLAGALKQVCSWSDEERRDRGKTMRKHVEVYYSWRVIWERWKSLYGELDKVG